MPRIEMLRKKYDAVIGLGHNCGCAKYLMQRDLRGFSSPFDWIGSSNIGVTGCLDIISARFKGFFEKENLVHVAHQGECLPTAWYVDRVSGIISAHDIRKDLPFDEAFERAKSKFNRRQQRVLDALNSGKRVLLVCWNRGVMSLLPEFKRMNEWLLERNPRGFPTPEPGKIMESVRRLRAEFPAGEVDLLYIEHDDESSDFTVDVIGDGVTRVRGRIAGKGFDPVMGIVEANVGIFKQIRLHGRWKNILTRIWGKYRARIATQLDFRASKRRAARAKMRDGQCEF